MKQHKIKWIVVYKGGGIVECATESQAKIIAMNDIGVFKIIPPVYR